MPLDCRYELSAGAAGGAVLPSSASFTVQAEPTRVDLVLERTSAEVIACFVA